MRLSHASVIVSIGLVGLLAAPARVSAWDSICSKFADPTADTTVIDYQSTGRGCEGIEAARQRWRDPAKHVDEHRQIFEAAVLYAGLPLTLLETQKLAVFVEDEQVTGADGQTTSVKPRKLAWDDPDWMGIKAAPRAFAIDELAQLPDFSYALWDWASGNETCPLPLDPTPDAQACHTFKTHMGATNANHFPPQSDAWFTYYHQLALDRAHACTANRTAARAKAQARGEDPDAMDDNLKEVWKACEVEALAYEAVAQHFLHDSWSAGHMWERWGSSDLNTITNLLSFPSFLPSWDSLSVSDRRLLIAESVAAVAGTIHGSDPPFFDGAILGISATLHDPMCYPDSSVQAFDSSGSLFNVVGDLHLHDTISAPGLPTHDQISSRALDFDPALLQTQGTKLMDCAAGALTDVYVALKGGDFEPALGDAPASPLSFDAGACVAPRATNLAIFRGIYDRPIPPLSGLALKLELTRVLVGTFVVSVVGPALASFDLGNMPLAMFGRITTDYLALTLKAALRAVEAPIETDMAVAPMTLLGLDRNGAYASEPPEELRDPKAEPDSFAFDGGGGTNVQMGSWPDSKVFWLTQAFHHSRMPEVCTRQDDTEYRIEIAKLLKAARADIGETPSSPEEQRARDAVCQACAEWIGPFIWNTNSWDGSKLTGAPLCSYSARYPTTKTMDPDQGGGWGLEPDTVLTDPDGADKRWFAHYPTQNSHAGYDPIPIGYESPLSYVGGHGDETPEELAKLMCCAKLDTGGGTGNFRLRGKLTGQPLDSTVTFFLTPAAAPEIEAEDLDPDYEQPVLAHLPGGDSTKGVRAMALSQSERFGLKFDVDPQAKAVYDTAKAVTPDPDNTGYEYNFGNPAKNWLPAAVSFRLTPLMAMDEKRGEHCTFDPPSRTFTLNPDHPEEWNVDFAMDCSENPTFHIGYPRQFKTWSTVSSKPVDTPEGDKQWVYAQRVYAKGPLELDQLGLVTPVAGASTVRMAVYKETSISFLSWTASAELVVESGEQGLGNGQNLVPTLATLDEGAYWIVAAFTGSSNDTMIAWSPWRIGFGFGAAWLIPYGSAFEPQINLGVGDFRDWRLNLFMSVK